MWEYDGVNSIDESNGNYLTLDEIPTGETPEYSASWRPINNSNNTSPSLYFCAPPDLLRWCTANADITDLFRASGQRNTNTSDNYVVHNVKYGLKGRICPYLLKPVPNITSTASMFRNCNHLYGYKYDGRVYLIPLTFFTYATKITDLSYMFTAFSFEKDPQLSNVFAPLTNSLNIKGIFYHAVFGGGTSKTDPSNVSSVFISNKISNPRMAFSQNSDSTSLDVQTGFLYNQYVKFSTIFTSNKVEKAEQYHVFDGYGRDYVTHEENPSVSTENTRYNYRTNPEK